MIIYCPTGTPVFEYVAIGVCSSVDVISSALSAKPSTGVLFAISYSPAVIVYISLGSSQFNVINISPAPLSTGFILKFKLLFPATIFLFVVAVKISVPLALRNVIVKS